MNAIPSPASRPRRTAVVLAAAALAALTISVATSSAAPRAVRATAPACQTAGLDVWLNTQGNGAAGTIFYKLNFTNLSGHTCTLRGFPGVSAINLGGRMLGSTATRMAGTRVRTVTMGFGRTVSANLGIVEAGNFSNCHVASAAGLRVYPPNQRASRTVPYPFLACSNAGPGILKVQAIR
ncbi:MAG: DUF4232 domain-containing protein [Solirubrobacteraceae bacterium]